MLRKRLQGLAATAAALALLLCASPAVADFQLIVNGGFEAGFGSWSRVDQLGSEGTFFLQSGSTSPVNFDPVPAPPGGLNAAMTDAQAGGSHVLYQDFVVPAGLPSAVLSFQLFIGNRGGSFVTPNTLDWSTPTLNQQVRVDILRGGTDPFSVSAADVLANAYQSRAGDPAVTGYTTVTLNITNLFVGRVGQTLRLRFAEADNLGPLQLGVDNVGLLATVPEPSSFLQAAVALGIAAPAWLYRRHLADATAPA